MLLKQLLHVCWIQYTVNCVGKASGVLCCHHVLAVLGCFEHVSQRCAVAKRFKGPMKSDTLGKSRFFLCKKEKVLQEQVKDTPTPSPANSELPYLYTNKRER
ncbi:hypothetical protein ATANTOWER_022111 [Ataeniobius toweri]|uniref:Secreted protein n=1 Tax=Ataeniobius toweri TaxID=208326 RepID=A0ABU7BRU9_9TELE|nr:hypothetical protein [Ataeniobius toweri]